MSVRLLTCMHCGKTCGVYPELLEPTPAPDVPVEVRRILQHALDNYARYANANGSPIAGHIVDKRVERALAWLDAQPGQTQETNE